MSDPAPCRAEAFAELTLSSFPLRRDDPTPARGNQLMRATSLILASLGFIHDFRTGTLEPDEFRGIPRERLSMFRGD